MDVEGFETDAGGVVIINIEQQHDVGVDPSKSRIKIVQRDYDIDRCTTDQGAHYDLMYIMVS